MGFVPNAEFALRLWLASIFQQCMMSDELGTYGVLPSALESRFFLYMVVSLQLAPCRLFQAFVICWRSTAEPPLMLGS